MASISLTCWNKKVYEPSDDSFLLIDALEQNLTNWSTKKPSLIVELGSGSGFVICSLAILLKQHGLQVSLLAIDHNKEATNATSETLQRHGVTDVEVVNTSFFQGLQHLEGRIDVIVFNPPYVPTPDEECRQQPDIVSAWAGGDRGRRVIDQFLALAPAMLSAEGEVFLVTVSENDPQGIIQEMAEKGFSGSIVMERQADEECLAIVRLKRGTPAAEGNA